MHAQHMQRALDEAKRALELGEVPVGAAVVSGAVAGVAAGALLAPQPHSSSAKVSVRAITLFIILFLSCW